MTYSHQKKNSEKIFFKFEYQYSFIYIQKTSPASNVVCRNVFDMFIFTIFPTHILFIILIRSVMIGY